MEERKVFWCISKYASPPAYGAVSRLFQIAKRFSDMGADVVLISSDSNHLAKYPESKETFNIETFGKLQHLWIKTRKYKNSASLQRIMSWFDFEYKLSRLDEKKLRKPNVVIVSSLSLLTILNGIRLKKKYKCRLVFEIRDIYPLTMTEELGASNWNPLVLLLKAVERTGYKKADLIVGTMPNLKEHVEEILGYKKEVFYSPIGIHSIWSDELKQKSRVDGLFPNDGRFIIGYAGSMGITNALGDFIKAIEILAENSKLYFVLVGDGDLKEKYIERLSGLKNVRIGPKIDQNEVPYFLSKCDLLYLSTHNSKVWKYGQSMNKLIDYMMAGKPVVASYSGYQSMLNEADSGKFISNGNPKAIIEAIMAYCNMDSDDRKLYGTRAREWIMKNYNYDNIAEQYYWRLTELLN